MHAQKKMYGGDLNENYNFNDRKLAMHVYIILYGGALNGNEYFKGMRLLDTIYLSFGIEGLT